ncbi:hypothetical protein EDB81DRAFT_764127 [Dactylonectria macrodidyma]|uniref:NACHT domain-containing protein n=1 Tax=Dactylonectria macrodidyma TaxID=307937 RepID=A0A9P9E1E9_9HYPO|nr:hypothetical protein EDB81DRAFT_764127 [Dactylonectria macrodidyma]
MSQGKPADAAQRPTNHTTSQNHLLQLVKSRDLEPPTTFLSDLFPQLPEYVKANYTAVSSAQLELSQPGALLLAATRAESPEIFNLQWELTVGHVLCTPHSGINPGRPGAGLVLKSCSNRAQGQYRSSPRVHRLRAISPISKLLLTEEQQNCHIPRLLEHLTHLKHYASLGIEIERLGKNYQSDIYCVLDGIDESADDWNEIKSGPLDGLIALLQSIPRMRLLLIGRQSSLRMALRRWPLRIELTRDLVQDDLNRFISFELDNCPSITDDAIRNNVRIELESKSTVMFLWIKLIFQELRASFSLSEVTSTLSRLPNELDREYCRLFSALMGRLGGRSNNPSVRTTRARRLLSLIVGASRPLTIEELRLAYASASPSTSPEPCYQENLISEEGIIDGCEDFITTNGNLIISDTRLFESFSFDPLANGRAATAASPIFALTQKNATE